MFQRQRSGSVLCPSCQQLVGVNDERCFHCGRRNPGLWGYAGLLRGVGLDAGFVPAVIWGCGILYVLTLAVQPSAIGMSGFDLLSPGIQALFLFGASGSVPVFAAGRWWTVLSAGWLHGSLLHIVFNMMAVRSLAPAAVELYGPGRTAILYTVSTVTGFALSSTMGYLFPGLPLLLRGAPVTIGASAAICGIIGALVHYGRRTANSYISQSARGYVVMLLVIGVLLPGIDNWAHMGGFAGGYVVSVLLDPLRGERGDHLVWGVACLVATALSVLFSVINGWAFVH